MLDSSSVCSKGSALQCIFIIYYPLLTTNTNCDHLLTTNTNCDHLLTTDANCDHLLTTNTNCDHLLTTDTNCDHLLTTNTNFFHKVLFIIIAGSLSLGKALPELQTFAVALGSATAVFAVIDRVSI